MTTVLTPSDETQLAAAIASARENRTALDISGGMTKEQIGRPTRATMRLSTSELSGITLYEPNEMVMSARAGTPISAIRATLAQHGQALLFEPCELAHAVGGNPARATIGAIFATNASGSRRISAGAARDHLLGIRAVNGRGEIFKNGGRVMKNVTGYDLARALCGSWGTLSVLTEVTFKVMPVPAASTTLVLLGLPDEIAIEVLTTAMGTPYEVSGACHLQARTVPRIRHPVIRTVGKSVTAIRLEALPKSLDYRREQLAKLLKPFGALHDLAQNDSERFWQEVTDGGPLVDSDLPLWRISTAPANGPKLVASLARYMETDALYDWSGGLIWLEVPSTSDAGAADVRRLLATYGGHATLIRGTPEARGPVGVCPKQDPPIMRPSQRIKAAFDPENILNPGRMYIAF